MDRRVPTVRTTPSMLDFHRALLRAWRTATGALPAKPQACVLGAHFAGETGDGKSCWNWNLGNYKFFKGAGAFMSLAGVWEGFRWGDEDGDGDVDEDDRVLFVARMIRTGLWKEDPSKDHARAVGPRKVSLVATAANPTTFFRAFDTLDLGMASFLAAKQNPKSRYASAWPFIVRGDPDGYARELGRKGYYTADPNVYARSLRAKWSAWMAAPAFDQALAELVAAADAPTEPELPDVSGDDEGDPESTRIHLLSDFAVVHPAVTFEPRTYDPEEW